MNLLFKYRYLILLLLLVISLSMVFTFRSDNEKITNAKSVVDYVVDLVQNVQTIPLHKDNKVLFNSDLDTSIAVIKLSFRVGSYVDPVGKEGAMNLLTYALLNGAGNKSAADIQGMLEDYSINMDISVDRTNMTITVVTLNYYLKHTFELLDLILLHPRLDQKSLNMAKNYVYSNINLQKSNYSSILDEELRHNLFPKSKIYRNIQGSIESVNNVDVATIRKLYKTYITSGNMYVSVSGNILKNTIVDYFNKIIDNLPEGVNLQSNKIKVEPVIVDKDIVIKQKRINQSEIYAVIPFNSLSEDIPYAKIVAAYLGQMPSSYLFNELRNKLGLVYNVNMYLYDDDISQFWLISLGTSSSNAKQVVNKIREIISHQQWFNYQDIMFARDWFINNNLQSFVDNRSIASFLNNLQARGVGLQVFSWNYDKYLLMKPENISLVINSNFKNPKIFSIRLEK